MLQLNPRRSPDTNLKRSLLNNSNIVEEYNIKQVDSKMVLPFEASCNEHKTLVGRVFARR